MMMMMMNERMFGYFSNSTLGQDEDLGETDPSGGFEAHERPNAQGRTACKFYRLNLISFYLQRPDLDWIFV